METGMSARRKTDNFLTAMCGMADDAKKMNRGLGPMRISLERIGETGARTEDELLRASRTLEGISDKLDRLLDQRQPMAAGTAVGGRDTESRLFALIAVTDTLEKTTGGVGTIVDTTLRTAYKVPKLTSDTDKAIDSLVLPSGSDLLSALDSVGGGAGAGGALGKFLGSDALELLAPAVLEMTGTIADSMFGANGSTMLTSTISGAISGAAIGTQIFPGLGSAIGAGAGALIGLAQGATRVFEKKDDAFRDVVQERFETVSQWQDDQVRAGIEFAAVQQARSTLEATKNDPQTDPAAGLAGTYIGLSGTLEQKKQETWGKAGDAFIATRSPAMQEQTDYLSGDTGKKMQELYSKSGELEAMRINRQEELQREAMTAVLEGVRPTDYKPQAADRLMVLRDEYLNAMAVTENKGANEQELESALATLDSIVKEVEVLAQNEYQGSSIEQTTVNSGIELIKNISADTVMDESYYNAGFRMGEQLSKGIQAAESTNRVRYTVELQLAGNYMKVLQPYLTGESSSSADPNYNHYLGGPKPNAPKRAFGLNFVPYDDYPAVLHYGERVLTAQQARQQDVAGTGRVVVTGNNFTVRETADIERIASALVRQLRIAQAAAKPS